MFPLLTLTSIWQLGRVNIMDTILFPFEKHLIKPQTVTQQTHTSLKSSINAIEKGAKYIQS